MHGSSSTGTRYTLTGNSIALTTGVSAASNSGTEWANTVSNALVLNSNQTFSTGPLTSLAFAGAINLNGKDLAFDTAAGSPIDPKQQQSSIFPSATPLLLMTLSLGH